MVGHRARFGTLLVRALVVVVPVVLVPTASSLSVGYCARRGAALLWNLGSRVPAPSFALASTLEPVPAELEIFASVSDVASNALHGAVAEPRQRSLLHKNVIAGRRGAHRIHVSPDL